MNNTIRIILADDQLLIRAGIHALLDSLPECELVAECSDGHQAIAAVLQHKPDVILLDIATSIPVGPGIAMPGPTGIEVARAIRLVDQETRILMLSSIDRRETIEEAMQAGADGYLLKDFVLAELLAALAAVRNGQRYLSPRIEQLRLEPTASGNPASKTLLTARQLEVLRMVASGKTTKEIARLLCISPKTVEFHRGRLMERIGAHDVTGLTRFALQNGVLC